jgi:2-polyprenyl-3-methyl-5-hydroxy-6-metoxy-1,4-benzoquinol methylase
MSAAPAQPPPEFYDQNDSDQTCFLCNTPAYTLHFEIAHFGFPFSFKACQCGLIKQIPMPNTRFFEWFFNSEVFFSSRKTDKDDIWGYYDYFSDEPARLATSRHRFRKLQDLFDSPALNIMKIGPATGTFLHVLKEAGHQVRGCDVSNRFANYAMENYGVPIDIGRFEHMQYADGQFDRLLLFNVIENVPNLDEFLQAIQRTVKPGGYFVLNVVDMANNGIAALQKDKYFIYRPPVCYVFTMAVLEKVLRKYGFEPVRRHRDIRYLHLEKISTLLRWRWLLKLSRALGVHRITFPIYAYPSWIVVARRI